MKTFITSTIFLSCLFSQSIVGSWELTSPYTSEVDGKAHALIRHNYSSDGDFTDSPAWGGNTSDWTIVTNSTCGAGASSSYTLRLDVATGSGTKYLSSQQTSSWGSSQLW